uniref:NADH-ubiquinone oxidoreductase chain 1 n=1 Tax=Tegula argyrostoma TaxID=1906927 RepID=A0A1I9SSU4_9VEST|nr:NADH dehydrogenase subunit 1 [Tegula argyrostoma]AOZ71814.1 NADH dehydrogenase subunit 1 [Tegula argyrostoma]
MIFSSILCTVVTYICVLLGVAFFTLLERKGLGYFQIRKGPNKVGVMGLPQPLADAAKLFTKELTKPTLANQSPYFFAPVMSLILALLLWQLYPSESISTYFIWGMLFFLCVSSLNVYGTLLAGWASNSKYALLGAIRAVAQTVSYEVSLALILLFVLLICGSFDFVQIKHSSELIWLSLLMTPIFLIWFVSCIAETNRTPFDFAEGESELVSGFNIEYGAGGFALIFMAEYGNILVMSLFTSVLFFSDSIFSFIQLSDTFMVIKALFFSFVFIWVRGTLPRFRYDLLMRLMWKVFLPVALSGLLLVGGVLYMFYVLH